MANKNEKDMKQKIEIDVDGFLFYDEKEAEQARREIEGVRYIQEKMDKTQPEMVLKVYNQVVRQNMFETVVGQNYLRDLQEYLRAIPEIPSEYILPIPIEKKRRKPEPKREAAEQKKQKAVAQNVDYKKKFQISLILNVVFFISILCMFLINLTSNSPTILNYETELINKYEQWEEELEEREQILKERESALE